MDFVALPPEINSARMYAGPGAGPLMEAAAAWEATATQLSLTASAIADVISGLEGTWFGLSSQEMAATMTRYVTWLATTAGQAYDTGARAVAAAAAYEAAFAATVPPPEIAANRSLHKVLVATNFLGINTAAIMATEAQYAEMWAQDVAAMFGYQAASAQALHQYTLPTKPVHPIGQSTGWSIDFGNVQSILSNIFAPGSNQSTTGLAGLLNLFSGSSGSAFGSFLNSTVLNSLFSSGFYYGLPTGTIQALTSMFAISGIAQAAQGANNANSSASPGEAGGPDSVEPAGSMGSAEQVGALSTPQSWGQAVNKTSVAEPLAATAPEDAAPMGGLFPAAAPVARGVTERTGSRYGMPVKVIPQLVGS